MKRLVCLAAALAACWSAAAGDAPPKETPKPERETQDVVYFGESRPVLLRLHVTLDGRPLSALWEDCVTKVFKFLDADGNGYLDRGEAQRVPPAGALFGGQFDGATPAFDELDTDHDGKVSRDELAAYYRRAGATPFQVAGGRGYNSDVRTRLALAELEQALIEEQVAFQARGGRGRVNPDSVNDALFKLLDTDGDGKLSKAELLAAPAVLLKHDRNDDEMITRDEILPGAGRGGNDYARLVAFRTLMDRANAGGPDGPFWLAHHGASKAELARRLLDQYRGKNAPDRPAPTKLSRQDLGMDEASFRHLDVDGDGFLDTEELARFAQRTPDLELKIDLGAKGSVELVKRGAPLEASVRPGKDGVLMLEMNGTRLDLKGLANPKTDFSVTTAEVREHYLVEFKKADRDGNGYLDKNEAMRSPLYRNLFKLMDRDGDGMLYEKEVLAYLDANAALQAAARLSCATVAVTSEGKGLFEMLDADGDGRLSVREMRNAVKLIAELDRDGDGCVSKAEIPRCSVATFRIGPAAGGNDLGSYPPAQALVVRAPGRGQRPPAKPARGPEWFRKMDRNGDGDVSRREFLGTDEQFRAIDTNGDGLISVEEAEAYDQKMRQKK
jgi:Ca2+-binding EF-hand superfamily protein